MGAKVRMTKVTLSNIFNRDVRRPVDALKKFFQNLETDGVIKLLGKPKSGLITGVQFSYDGIDLKIPFDGISKEDFRRGLLDMHKAVYDNADDNPNLGDDAISKVYTALLCIGAKENNVKEFNLQNDEGYNIEWGKNYPVVEKQVQEEVVTVADAVRRGEEQLNVLEQENQVVQAKVDPRKVRLFVDSLKAMLHAAQKAPQDLVKKRTRVSGIHFEYAEGQKDALQVGVDTQENGESIIYVVMHPALRNVMDPQIEKLGLLEGGPVLLNELMLKSMAKYVETFNKAVQFQNLDKLGMGEQVKRIEAGVKELSERLDIEPTPALDPEVVKVLPEMGPDVNDVLNEVCDTVEMVLNEVMQKIPEQVQMNQDEKEKHREPLEETVGKRQESEQVQMTPDEREEFLKKLEKIIIKRLEEVGKLRDSIGSNSPKGESKGFLDTLRNWLNKIVEVIVKACKWVGEQIGLRSKGNDHFDVKTGPMTPQ